MGEWGKGGAPKREGGSMAGEVLEKLHRKTKITKSSMAEKLGISLTGYQSYFNHEMRIDTLLKVVDAFGYHMEIHPGATGLIEFRDKSCEDCEFRRYVEHTEGDLVVDFYEGTNDENI